MGASFARAHGRRAAHSGRAAGRSEDCRDATRSGGTGMRAQARREYRALPRGALRMRDSSIRCLRQPRAACPVMLDLFLHLWDDDDDS
jgi:hypothetical protein